jgi:hypothetical protein
MRQFLEQFFGLFASFVCHNALRRPYVCTRPFPVASGGYVALNGLRRASPRAVLSIAQLLCV